ncbi:hypothetical protein CHH49_00720 [Terribacillus saccharophilus]|uniref:serine hydrolase n=1 Tax=Terribacillus saccharophilus TaxID=361277 RepID=UPI000BA50784|nr:serine hydrolase domain-containing protein [Terribacillus saccharophilus]PAF23117.1 hypothetical protein CHH49_00720 [Terribacillus saccharophilus]
MLHMEDIELYIEVQIKNKEVPGFALSIINESEVLYEKSFDLTNWEDKNQPITENTIFRIGSVSKSLTATLIMKLVDMSETLC